VNEETAKTKQCATGATEGTKTLSSVCKASQCIKGKILLDGNI
jgi:hypothetical protein